MADEVKFAYQTNKNLVFTAYRPSGLERGLPQQPLTEILPTGYYRATPLTALTNKDTVIVREAEVVLWETDTVTILTRGILLYEGERVFYEEDWVYDSDEESEVVTYASDPIGVGEYKSSADVSVDLDSMLQQQRLKGNVYDYTGEQSPEPTVINL